LDPGKRGGPLQYSEKSLRIYRVASFSIDHMGSAGLMPIGIVNWSSGNSLWEKELLIGASIFHILIGFVILRVPGVKDMKMPKKKMMLIILSANK
jgi:hypothetical protein